MSDDIPDSLLRDFIDFADEAELELEAAGKLLTEYARQRKPELEAERVKDAVAYQVSRDISEEIESSESISIVMRIMMKTRVRYFSMSYFPRFHVVSPLWEYWWCSIAYSRPSWNRTSAERVYLDDLFHDAYYERFWMPEPYLSELPLSKEVYEAVSSEHCERLENTLFRKVDPVLMAKFLEERSSSLDYVERECDESLSSSPPYGSKGWQGRIKRTMLGKCIGYRRKKGRTRR